MDALVGPHVHLGEHRARQGQGGRLHRLGRAQEREDRAVMIRVDVDGGEADTRDLGDGPPERGHGLAAPAFAHVGHALENGPCHGAIIAKPLRYTTCAMPALPVGKLPPLLLQRLLSAHASDDPRVIVGPQVGEDAAVLDIGDRYLVATADPITFATAELGWYALHVNANDLAVRGARPLWFLATVLLPARRAELASSTVRSA